MSEPPDRPNKSKFVRDAVIAHQDEIRHRLDRGQNMAEILAALSLPAAVTLDSFRRAFSRLEKRLALRAAARSSMPPPRQPTPALPSNAASAVTYLAVPFAEKDAAKAAGAQWDKARKAWFVPVGTDLTPLQRFSPSPTPHQEVHNEPGRQRKPFVRYDRLDPEKVARWNPSSPNAKGRQD